MKPIANKALPVKRRKKKKEQTALYTTTAPLEIISFFYRMGRKATEERKSSLTLQLPDDTPVPDPVCSYRLSGMGSTDSYCGSPYSIMSLGKNSSEMCSTIENSPMHLTSPDRGVMDSSSWFADDDLDEVIVDGSPSVLVHKSQLSSNEVPEDSSMSAHKKGLNIGKPRSIKGQKSRICERRTNSSDCSYYDENEAFTINIADFNCPEKGECLSGEEKRDGELPFLKLTKDKLSADLLSASSSKTYSNSRLRRQGQLPRISWKKNSFVTGALIRAATTGNLKCSPKASFEEKQEQWSVRVVPLSFFTSSESIGQDEAKNDTRPIRSASSEK